LYFDDEEAARSAASTLDSQGFAVNLAAPVTELAQWRVIASGVPDTRDLDVADDRFADWVADVGGEFDGHAS
jgi:Regulator of ribonuclease activity B